MVTDVGLRCKQGGERKERFCLDRPFEPEGMVSLGKSPNHGGKRGREVAGSACI